MSLRARVHALLEPAAPGDRGPSRWADATIAALVLIDLLLFVVGAESNLPASVQRGVRVAEEAIVLAFAVEYALRLWACVEGARFRAPRGSRLRYALTPLAVVDLLAALPALALVPGLQAVFPLGMSTLKGFRLLRLVRVGKLVRYSPSMRAFGRAIGRVREELMVVLVFVTVLTLTGASFIVRFERGAQPEAFGDFADGIWWAIVTMTTVGYGDVVPITPYGRLVAAVLAIGGIGMFAAPAGLLAAAFSDEMQRERSRHERQRERQRRAREDRRLEQLVEVAVEEALVDVLEERHVERAVAAARAAARSAAPGALRACPHCGEALPGRD